MATVPVYCDVPVFRFLVKLGLPDSFLLLAFGFARADVSAEYDNTRSKRFNMTLDQIGETLRTWVITRHDRDKYFSLSELSDRVNIPERYLRQYFKEHNTCFRQWRMDVRIEEAMNIMRREPGRTAVSIARELGFDDSSNFYRQFKRANGCSPKEWRMNNH